MPRPTCRSRQQQMPTPEYGSNWAKTVYAPDKPEKTRKRDHVKKKGSIWNCFTPPPPLSSPPYHILRDEFSQKSDSDSSSGLYIPSPQAYETSQNRPSPVITPSQEYTTLNNHKSPTSLGRQPNHDLEKLFIEENITSGKMLWDLRTDLSTARVRDSDMSYYPSFELPALPRHIKVAMIDFDQRELAWLTKAWGPIIVNNQSQKIHHNFESTRAYFKIVEEKTPDSGFCTTDTQNISTV
ncbi:hypothetical protein CVT25_007001 [Psilocybe cyanescens]|uniref:Uncharacterized protein n=1 Tax=Psilocybe cyanescens TaxID=93625 RepID=A0A409WYG8_PSICY|nr:hypothetical protein CVT25_007001 [Psilocybe cyanescens]